MTGDRGRLMASDDGAVKRVVYTFLEYYAGPVLALVVPVALAVVASMLNRHRFLISTTEFFIGLILYIVADSTGRMRRDREMDFSHRTLMESLRRRIDGTFRVTLLKSDELDAYLKLSFARAYAVRNTFIGIKRLYGRAADRESEVTTYYELALAKKNAFWEDIVGIDEFFDGRYDRLAEKKDILQGRHRISVLASHTPVINFVLCGATDKDFSEVFFGWVRVTGVDVFYSRDRRLIRMFDKYFDTLTSGRTRIVDVVENNYPIVDTTEPARRAPFWAKAATSAAMPAKIINDSWIKWVMGTWITVDGGETQPDKIREYTKVEISYHDELTISGEVYDLAGNMKATFLSKYIVLLDKALMYRYMVGPTEGIAIYKLLPDNRGMVGYFVRDGAERSEAIRAIKSDRDWKSSIRETLVKICRISA